MSKTARTRHQSPAHRGLVPLALVSLLVVTLVGSVLIPALDTWRIMRLLREMTEVIEPARILSWRLESGLAMEYSALQHRAPRLGPRAVEDAAVVRRRITEWQALNRVLFDGHLSREQFAVVARTQRALRDSIIDEIDRLPSRLSAVTVTRRAEVRVHERRSLLARSGLDATQARGALVEHRTRACSHSARSGNGFGVSRNRSSTMHRGVVAMRRCAHKCSSRISAKHAMSACFRATTKRRTRWRAAQLAFASQATT